MYRFEVRGGHVEALPYTTVRNNLAKTLDKVCDEHEPILITRRKAETAVLLSLSHFESLQETVYLLSSSRNASRLQEALVEINSGHAQKRDLIDP